MAKKKSTEIELKIKNYQKPEINHAFQRSVSYSQFSMWDKCPHQWYLTYVENKQPYQASIHTVFGTAFHETLQDYITVMYNESGAAADRMDLIGLFQSKFSEVYAKEYKAAGAHFTNAEEMGEFFEDASAILNFVEKNRNKLFIDFVLYDEELDKVYIYDIKTSTRGWSDKEKKDDSKIAQILLYKEYFSKQFGFDVEKIEVEYFIVKRKIWEQSEYSIPRTQSFKPASGKNKRKLAVENFQSFIKDCFDESGKPQMKSYLKNVGESSCKWCPYKDSPELCDKIASSI